MKYKVGDKVRIKSKEWYENNKDKDCDGDILCGDVYFMSNMKDYCGKTATITEAKKHYRIDLDNGRWCWSDELFEDSTLDNAEKPHISEQLIKDIADVIKSHNLGVSVSENEGKLIIEPMNVEEDLEKGTYVMVTNDINNEPWTLRQYLSNGCCDIFITDTFHLPAMKFRFIIAFDKFNPNNIEESLKYNIVK